MNKRVSFPLKNTVRPVTSPMTH
uniref:Uncharacterized protein n=1 Tax=Anguilla anguilla TaxID=7936 RepID=A0A0E9PS73_ANGAN